MRNIFIDSIEKISDSVIEGSKFLSLNEDIFKDHFPNSPMLPAALMVEASIQLSRLFIWNETDFVYTLLPVTFSNFKFFDIIRPGNILKVSLEINEGKQIEYALGKNLKIKTFGFCNNKKIFKGIIQFQVMDFSKLHNENLCREYLNFLVDSITEHN